MEFYIKNINKLYLFYLLMGINNVDLSFLFTLSYGEQKLWDVLYVGVSEKT